MSKEDTTTTTITTTTTTTITTTTTNNNNNNNNNNVKVILRPTVSRPIWFQATIWTLDQFLFLIH
jgi:hypothetical protein